jgi:hypothetical protein
MPRVLNKRTDGIPEGAVYVGRGSKWGNPYKLADGLTREECINLFRLLLTQRMERGVLDPAELRGRDLVCYCAPLPCHGDILLEISNAPQQPAGGQGE